MNSDHLSDWLTYINSNRPNEGDFGLGRLEDIYSQIVQSPVARKTILVGGTNGKGSTIEFLKNFLLSAGYKIGSYTSPHLLESYLSIERYIKITIYCFFFALLPLLFLSLCFLIRHKMCKLRFQT